MLLGQVPHDHIVRVGTVSCCIGVGKAIKGVTVPRLDSFKPHLLDWETKTSMVEKKPTRAPMLGRSRLHGLKTVLDAWAAMAMAWAAPYR